MSVSPSPMGMYGLNQTMPIKKDEMSALVNKPELNHDEYLRDASPTGNLALNNNFNQTTAALSPQINVGSSAASPHLNQRDAMNKTVNVQKDKH